MNLNKNSKKPKLEKVKKEDIIEELALMRSLCFYILRTNGKKGAYNLNAILLYMLSETIVNCFDEDKIKEVIDIYSKNLTQLCEELLSDMDLLKEKLKEDC
jgi:hypothetical protein